MKKFCESLRKHAMKIINFIKKKNEVINKRTPGIMCKMQNARIDYICKENIKINMIRIKNIIRLKIIFIMQVNIEVLHIVSEIKK